MPSTIFSIFDEALFAATAIASIATIIVFRQKRKIRQCMQLNRVLRKKAQKATFLDDTTSAYNYAHFVRHANRVVVDARRKQKSVTLLIVDIDRLESINIRYGFRTGDLVLKKVYEAIRMSVRSNDIVGRFGGSGFFVLLGACDADGAESVVLKIDKELGRKTVPTKNGNDVGFSVKYSSSSAVGRHVQLGRLIENAERAVDRLKHERLFFIVTDHNGLLLKKEPAKMSA